MRGLLEEPSDGIALYLTTTGTSGAATYNSITGILNVPNYSISGGTPGGSDTQVQFNDGGVFGGLGAVYVYTY